MRECRRGLVGYLKKCRTGARIGWWGKSGIDTGRGEAKFGGLLAAGVGLALLVAGCASAEAPPVRVLEARIDKQHLPTYLGLPLATGQVILSEAPGAYSFWFSLVPERYYDFTHAGLIVMENGEPFVYDVSGHFAIGIYDRPTDGIVGELRRVPLLDYCRPNLYAEIFDPPEGVDRAKVAAYIREKREHGILFDAYFRWDEHERLFCTEFVALALAAGGAKLPAAVPVRKNPSLAVVIEYLAVQRDFVVPAGLFADPARYVGALGGFGSRTAAYCYFEAKREIHRRFTADQKLGNVFVWNGADDLRLRDEIDGFLRRAVRLFDGVQRVAPSQAAISTAVRELAEETFGPCASSSPGAAGTSAMR